MSQTYHPLPLANGSSDQLGGATVVEGPSGGAASAQPRPLPPAHLHQPTDYMDRCNTSIVALGNLKRVYVWPFRGPWFVSPDLCAWLFPTGITSFLVCGTVYLTGSQQSIVGLAILFALLGTAFTCSLLVGITDPGVYPRLAHGERDPLEGVGTLAPCKICNHRRPRRAAHCYSCGVCVLEHDHHCGVLGGCVGQRSLRWFTLYLLSISSASAVGLYWVGWSLFYPPSGHDRPTASELMMQRNRRANQASLGTAAHIFLMIFIGNIVLIVGGMGLYYVYLIASDTTRREAQGKLPRSAGGESQASQSISALKRVFVAVPPSLLVHRSTVEATSKRDDDGTALV